MARRLVIAALTLMALASAVPLGLWLDLQSDARTLPGLRVAGARLPPTATPAVSLAPRAEALLESELGLSAGPVVVVRSRRGLGLSVDLEALSDELLAIAHQGALVADLEQWHAASRGRIDRPWPLAVDRRAVARAVTDLALEVDRDPTAALFHSNGATTQHAEAGFTLDRGRAAEAIARALVDPAVSVLELPVEAVDAPVPPPPPPRQAFGTLLASYTTRFRRAGGRGHNVRLAAENLDGAILAPGGELSFNGLVGARDLRSGFRVAPEIVRGEMVDGVGGGTCQVASTLHAAAFHGGLDVLEHTPHSRPAGYVPLGLDATVVWPDRDLVLRNPHGFPILVRARTDGRSLSIDLLGAGPAPAVTISRRVLARQDYQDRVVEDSSIPMGEEVVSQRGIPGFTVERVRTIDRGIGPERERQILRYPPTDRIVRIPTKPTG